MGHSCWVSDNGKKEAVRRHDLKYLFQVEPHMMTEDVEGGLCASSLRDIAFDTRGLEKPWVAKLVAGGKGEAQPMLVPIAMKQVQHRAAPRFMRLQEHQSLSG